MSVAGGMEHAGARVGNMGDDGDEVEVVHELDGILTRSLQTEGNDTAGAIGQVFLCQGVILVGRQSAVVHPAHTWVLFQPLGHLLGIGAMLLHAQGQRLEAQVEDVGVEGRRDAAQVAHQLADELGGVGHLAEGLGIGEAVVAFVGRGQAVELRAVGIPVEVARIDHSTAHLCSVSVHVFGGGVGHDVAAPFEGTAVDGSGKGVIDDEGHTMLVSHLGKSLDVEHVTARVGDGLAEEALRVRLEGCLDALVVPIGINEGALDAEFLERHAEEVECAAVDGVGGDEVVACLADVEDGIEVGSLS